METWIRLGHSIVRMFFGLVFSGLVVLLCLPMDKVFLYCHGLPSQLTSASPLIGTTLPLVAFIVLGSVGLFVLDVMLRVLRHVGAVLASHRPLCSIVERWDLNVFVEGLSETAMRLFQTNADDLLHYHHLKAISDPQHADQSVVSLALLQKADSHVREIKNIQLIEQLDYFASITQDQVLRDRMREEVQDMARAAVLSLALLIVVLINSFSFALRLLMMGFTIPFLLGCAVEFKTRKLRLGMLVIYGYLDTFCLGNGPDISDRDGTPY